MPDYKCLIYEVKDAVATLTLNRPERLNALGDTLRDDLYDAILRASQDPDIRAMVVTGAGKGFCAGGDVKAMNDSKEGRAPARPLEDKAAPPRDRVLLAMRDACNSVTAAYELARKIASGPPVAIRLAKRALYHSEETDLRGALEFETFAQNVCSETEDAREGIRAFVEKRTPSFKGR